MRVNPPGLVIAVFLAALAIVLGASPAWAVVIGLGTIPALTGVVTVLIRLLAVLEWLLDRRGRRRARARRNRSHGGIR